MAIVPYQRARPPLESQQNIRARYLLEIRERILKLSWNAQLADHRVFHRSLEARISFIPPLRGRALESKAEFKSSEFKSSEFKSSEFKSSEPRFPVFRGFSNFSIEEIVAWWMGEKRDPQKMPVALSSLSLEKFFICFGKVLERDREKALQFAEGYYKPTYPNTPFSRREFLNTVKLAKNLYDHYCNLTADEMRLILKFPALFSFCKNTPRFINVLLDTTQDTITDIEIYVGMVQEFISPELMRGFLFDWVTKNIASLDFDFFLYMIGIFQRATPLPLSTHLFDFLDIQERKRLWLHADASYECFLEVIRTTPPKDVYEMLYNKDADRLCDLRYWDKWREALSSEQWLALKEACHLRGCNRVFFHAIYKNLVGHERKAWLDMAFAQDDSECILFSFQVMGDDLLEESDELIRTYCSQIKSDTLIKALIQLKDEIEYTLESVILNKLSHFIDKKKTLDYLITSFQPFPVDRADVLARYLVHLKLYSLDPQLFFGPLCIRNVPPLFLKAYAKAVTFPEVPFSLYQEFLKYIQAIEFFPIIMGFEELKCREDFWLNAPFVTKRLALLWLQNPERDAEKLSIQAKLLTSLLKKECEHEETVALLRKLAETGEGLDLIFLSLRNLSLLKSAEGGRDKEENLFKFVVQALSTTPYFDYFLFICLKNPDNVLFFIEHFPKPTFRILAESQQEAIDALTFMPENLFQEFLDNLKAPLDDRLISLFRSRFLEGLNPQEAPDELGIINLMMKKLAILDYFYPPQPSALLPFAFTQAELYAEHYLRVAQERGNGDTLRARDWRDCLAFISQLALTPHFSWQWLVANMQNLTPDKAGRLFLIFLRKKSFPIEAFVAFTRKASSDLLVSLLVEFRLEQGEKMDLLSCMPENLFQQFLENLKAPLDEGLVSSLRSRFLNCLNPQEAPKNPALTNLMMKKLAILDYFYPPEPSALLPFVFEQVELYADHYLVVAQERRNLDALMASRDLSSCLAFISKLALTPHFSWQWLVENMDHLTPDKTRKLFLIFFRKKSFPMEALRAFMRKASSDLLVSLLVEFRSESDGYRAFILNFLQERFRERIHSFDQRLDRYQRGDPQLLRKELESLKEEALKSLSLLRGLKNDHHVDWAPENERLVTQVQLSMLLASKAAEKGKEIEKERDLGIPPHLQTQALSGGFWRGVYHSYRDKHMQILFSNLRINIARVDVVKIYIALFHHLPDRIEELNSFLNMKKTLEDLREGNKPGYQEALESYQKHLDAYENHIIYHLEQLCKSEGIHDEASLVRYVKKIWREK